MAQRKSRGKRGFEVTLYGWSDDDGGSGGVVVAVGGDGGSVGGSGGCGGSGVVGWAVHGDSGVARGVRWCGGVWCVVVVGGYGGGMGVAVVVCFGDCGGSSGGSGGGGGGGVVGKSTLVNSHLPSDLYKEQITLNAEERIDKTAEIQRSSIDIEEQGVRLRLTVVDTPGFGDSVNSENSWGPIISHIESKFEQYYRDESGLNRKNLIDDRVHCCLYFISPYGHGLRPIDIEFMKRLHDKVNIVPIIAKADCLTKTEVKRMKDRVLREISEHEIGIYAFPDCESDEDEDFKKQDQELKASIPFAVIGSNTVVEVNGRRVRGRLYPWGITEVENPKHCDFVKLRNMLIRTHMQDLKDVTRDVHYENYRLGRIRGGGTQLHRERSKNESKLKRDSGVFDEVAEKDRMLEQKEVELRQMQVMLEKMQREMAVTQRNSRGDNLQYDDRRSSTVEV
eukprot:XP_011680493.1 PREDICTED: LOW QUALITY PROTEIN: septin-1 [Strongylocentrotus purpuratus]